MRKLEHAGVKRSVVGLVVPTGYSFNLDGAAIYLSLAAVYLAQATGTNLTISQQLGLVAVMLLTSKGAAGVAGGGFIALAATLSTVGTIPPAAIMLIFGIDKFMSECRAVVNFIGNSVATLFVAWWDRAVDSDRVRRVLDREPVPALPAELDATTNPLAVESTKLDDEYHPHLHHEHHAPAPRYSVDDEVRRLGPRCRTPIRRRWSATPPSRRRSLRRSTRPQSAGGLRRRRQRRPRPAHAHRRHRRQEEKR